MRCPDLTTDLADRDQTSLSNFVVMQGSTGVSGLVQTIPFSLGYAVSEFAVADAVPVALIENARMQYTSPNNIVDTGNALASVRRCAADNIA